MDASDDNRSEVDAAHTRDNRLWESTKDYLSNLPPEVEDAAYRAAILHWFDPSLLSSVICVGLPPDKVAVLYDALKGLPIVEEYRDKGHAFHTATRRVMLDNLWKSNRELYRRISGRAASFFEALLRDADGAAWGIMVEYFYHLLISDQSRGVELATSLLAARKGDHDFAARLLGAIDQHRLAGRISTKSSHLRTLVHSLSRPDAGIETTDTRVKLLRAKTPTIHILWLNAGLGCDGDSVALTSATQPSIEEIALQALPGLPKIAVHWPLIDFECGPVGGADDFLEWFFRAERGELEPFVLVVEGSIPNEAIKPEGYWCGFGNNPATDQPMTTSDWLDRLAPVCTGILAVGTCATYGGIHAMSGNPTGAMGVADYLGWGWRSKAGLPVVNVPGCPIHPDNLSETILYLLYMATGQAPLIPLDDALRPAWLFGNTVHEGCDRAGYYEQGDFATEYGSPKCIVKLGCWGPVVKCNVPKRGWTNGVGGCPNVGGICIGCTMPGFPDKFMPFMDEPPGGKVSTAASGLYGSVIRGMREVTGQTVDKEPKWRAKGTKLLTGYKSQWR